MIGPRDAWLDAVFRTNEHVSECPECRMASRSGTETACEEGARLCDEEATAWVGSLPEVDR